MEALRADWVDLLAVRVELDRLRRRAVREGGNEQLVGMLQAWLEPLEVERDNRTDEAVVQTDEKAQATLKERILLLLYDGSRLRPAAIREQLEVGLTEISRALRGLARAGAISYDRDPADGRARLYYRVDHQHANEEQQESALAQEPVTLQEMVSTDASALLDYLGGIASELAAPGSLPVTVELREALSEVLRSAQQVSVPGLRRLPDLIQRTDFSHPHDVQLAGWLRGVSDSWLSRQIVSELEVLPSGAADAIAIVAGEAVQDAEAVGSPNRVAAVYLVDLKADGRTVMRPSGLMVVSGTTGDVIRLNSKSVRSGGERVVFLRWTSQHST